MKVLRNASLMCTVLFALPACAPRAADTAADAATIKADAPVWFTKYNGGDADGVAALYADDGVVLAPGAPMAVGRAAIRDFIAADIATSKAAGVTLKGDEVKDVGVAGETAWITGAFSAADASGATVDKGKYLAVYRRANGKWLIIRDIWNSDMPPAAAGARQ